MGKHGKYLDIFSRNKQKTTTEDNNKQSSRFDMSNFRFFGGVTSGIRCDAEDDTFFCQLTKFTAIISQLLFLVGIVIMIFLIGKYFILPLLFGKGKQRVRSKLK